VAPKEKEIADAIFIFYNENRESEFSVNSALEKQKYSWNNMVNAINSIISNVSFS